MGTAEAKHSKVQRGRTRVGDGVYDLSFFFFFDVTRVADCRECRVQDASGLVRPGQGRGEGEGPGSNGL